MASTSWGPPNFQLFNLFFYLSLEFFVHLGHTMSNLIQFACNFLFFLEKRISSKLYTSSFIFFLFVFNPAAVRNSIETNRGPLFSGGEGVA